MIMITFKGSMIMTLIFFPKKKFSANMKRKSAEICIELS